MQLYYSLIGNNCIYSQFTSIFPAIFLWKERLDFFFLSTKCNVNTKLNKQKFLLDFFFQSIWVICPIFLANHLFFLSSDEKIWYFFEQKSVISNLPKHCKREQILTNDLKMRKNDTHSFKNSICFGVNQHHIFMV